jgi:hypothetical protein
MGAREHEGRVEAMQELHVVSSVLGHTTLCGSLANAPAAAPTSSTDGGTGLGAGSRQEL